jgi:S-adenosylmethionine:tRNA ribosyltransferase-isomerase
MTVARVPAGRPVREWRVPEELSARVPAEQRGPGLGRDAVRLLVSRGEEVSHHTFAELPRLLRAGDLLVVNTSPTLAAAVDGWIGHARVVVHFSTRADDGRWSVELREPEEPGGTGSRTGGGTEQGSKRVSGRGKSPTRARADAPSETKGTTRARADAPSETKGTTRAHAGAGAETKGTTRARAGAGAETKGTTRARAGGPAGTEVRLPGGLRLVLQEPVSADADRLWWARASGADVLRTLREHGRPIRYGYTERDQPLSAYQTVFALPSPDGTGSAEMPSAARPFTARLVAELVSRGVQFAPVTLHTGVASAEAHEPPYPERFAVPEASARLINAVRAGDGRVIAVGTTAVRAVESAAGPDGVVRAREGWTDLVVTPRRGVRVVDGLLTGLHEPEASHLLMLEAVAGPAAIGRSYEEALRGRYLWHEFGDVHLILPGENPRPTLTQCIAPATAGENGPSPV